MATPTKDKLLEQLRALGVEPPPDASSRGLQELLKRTRALPAVAPGGDRPPRPPAVPPAEIVAPAPPPLTAPRPVASAPARPAEQRTTFVPEGRVPAVAPQPRTDHEQRPWDPLAGY